MVKIFQRRAELSRPFDGDKKKQIESDRVLSEQ